MAASRDLHRFELRARVIQRIDILISNLFRDIRVPQPDELVGDRAGGTP